MGADTEEHETRQILKIKNTKSLRKKLRPFCDDYNRVYDEFWKKLGVIEGEMEKATGIDGIEFYSNSGIGNVDKTMPLIFFEDIE